MRTKEVVGTVRKGVSLDTGSASLKPEGQASFEMANLRPDRTGLPFVVFISQGAERGTTSASKSRALQGSDRRKWSLSLFAHRYGL